MANTIQLKRSTTASAVPAAGSLAVGELAINVNPADRKLFSKDSGGTVFEIGGGGISAGTVDDSLVRWNATGSSWDQVSGVRITDDFRLRVLDDTGQTDYIELYHDANDAWIITSGTANLKIDGPHSAVQFLDGPQLQVYDATDVHYIQMYSTGSTISYLTTTSGVLELDAGGTVRIANGDEFYVRGGGVRFYDSTVLDYIEFIHDGTDLNINHGGTAEWNITGLTRINTGAHLDVGQNSIEFDDGVDGLSIFMSGGRVNATGTGGFTGWTLPGGMYIGAELRMDERTAAPTNTAGKGFLWFRNDAPNTLWYTDDVADDYPVGFNAAPPVAISASQNMLKAEVGKMLHKNAGLAVTLTCAQDSTTWDGATWLVHNDDTEDLTIAAGASVTVYWLEAGSAPAAGSVVVKQGGIVTVYKYSNTEFWVWGAKDPAAGGIANVVEDTTPQLGGNLASNTFDIIMDDNDRVYFGTGSDASIYFDATNLQIVSTAGDIYVTSGGGDIFLEDNTYVRNGGVLRVQDGTNADYMQINHDGTDINFAFGGTTNVDFSGASVMRLQSDMVLALDERATAPAGEAAYGTFWIKDDAPNTPWFTNDSSEDFPLGYAAYNLLGNQSLNMTTATVAEQCVNGIWYKTNTTAYTLTLETSSTTNFPVGAQMTIVNAAATVDMTINDQTTNTLYHITGSGKTDVVGSCTVGPGGYATLIRISATETWIMGSGVTA